MTEDIPTGYDGRSLDHFSGMTRAWAKDSYIFMINGAKMRAPAAALALQERLGIAKP
jgi:hypothetical protein